LGVLKKYLRSAAATARTEADFLESLAADLGSSEADAEHVPGPRSLAYSQMKNVWDGVNEQAKRLLGAFVLSGGNIAPQDLMKVLGVDEPRLLNGPLGGISRRVKKLLGDPDATFYSVNPDTGRYILTSGTFGSLSDVVEHERPEWLENESWISAGVITETNEGGSDE
jgi:hypothetical protein